MESHRHGEGSPPRFDELQRVQAGVDLFPARTFGDSRELIGQLLPDKGGIPVPLDDLASALDIDRTRFSVQAQAAPVPELEGEDIGRRADLKDHAAGAGAMDGARRNQVMVVLAGRNLIDILLRVEDNLTALGGTKVFDHRLAVYAFLQAQVHDSILRRVQQIITLVLGVRHPELLADELGRGMDLKAEVTPAHRVQEVEAYGEILAETRLDGLPQQLAAAQQDQILGRQFEINPIHFQQEAVLLRDAVEAPAIIGHAPVQVADFFHPLTAPGRRIEEGYDAERLTGRLVNATQEGLPADHLGLGGSIRVQPVIDPGKQTILMTVADAPVNEEPPLVLDTDGIPSIVDPESADLVPAHALLDLPPSHVDIDQQSPFGHHQARTGAQNHPGHPTGPGSGHFLLIEEILQLQGSDIAEQDVIRHERLRHLSDLRFRLHQGTGAQDRTERRSKHLGKRIFISPGIDFHGNGRSALCLYPRKYGFPTQDDLSFHNRCRSLIIIRFSHHRVSIV